MSDFSQKPHDLPDLDGLTRPLVELAKELRSIDETLREQNRASQRRIRWGALAAALAVVAVLLVGGAMWSGLATVRGQNRTVQQNQEEIKKQGRQIAFLGEVQITEALRRERDVLLHRERKEDCLIRPFNDVVQHRINSRTDKKIELCDPDKTLDELRPRIVDLNERIKEREMQGYG